MENITSKGTIFGTLIAQAGPKGDTGKTGDRGLTGEAGYSPIKGVDYFTQEDISEIRKGIEGDLTGEYNKNAIEKTNIFNTNAKETTTSFDLNAENKTKEYNDNALAEIEKYNSNAIEKSNNFDTNFENKTSKFDSNCDEKTKEFNDNNDLGIQNYNNNAKKQMEIFDTNFTEKLEAFNNNAGNKFNGFNTNSDKALAEYNKNHTAKMKEFDDNYDTKTKTFDDNAAAKLDEYNKNDKTKTDAYNKNTELKEKSFNDNAGTKTETFNTNAEQKETELEELAEEKINEYNQVSAELTAKVEQVQAENKILKAENKLIKEQIPSASASGNSVHIEDSGTLDFDWKIRGGHKQETREGYNLLDFNVTQNSKVTVNEDGTLTINGAGGFSLNIDKLQLKAGITYYQKVELISGSISGANINNTFLSFAGAGKWISSEIFTESSFNEDTEKTVIWINASATFDNAVIKIWANTNKSDFEQYGASPSPDYPSEIETVGSNVNLFDKDNVITRHRLDTEGLDYSDVNYFVSDYIEMKENTTCVKNTVISTYQAVSYYDKDKKHMKRNTTENPFTTPAGTCYIRICDLLTNLDTLKLEKGSVATPCSPFGMGSVEIDVVNKNFLVLDNVDEQTVNEMKYSCQNGEIEVQGTATATLDLFFPCKIVGYNNICTLNASADGELDKNACAIRMLKEGKNVTNANSFGNVYRTLKKPQIVPITADMKREKYQYICIHINEGTTANFKLKVWLNCGTDVTDYTRSQSQTAIMPIQQEMLTGDCISSVEHHEWGKLVLTGKENWNMLYGAGMFHVTNLVRVKDINSRTSISNYFKYNNANNGIYTNLEDGELAVQYYEGNTTLYIKYLNISTVEDFKTWLKTKHNEGNSVIIYYKQATPVDLELTEEQKAIREQKLYTYKNITNIAVSDELASIDVNYKKDPTTEHDELQNQIDEIKQLISTTETSALLLDNLQKDVESEVE